ncbi:MAG: 50S ribosomal protein L28 [Akkermansiaceae bacterium]|nr:50S ribosomal protein L28 [Akkermansiaceae bacterium]
MSRICNITLAMPHKGRRIHRSGLAKKKGGIGRHVTKTVNRTVYPNLQEKRIWVPELNGGRGGYIRMKLSCKALRTISKNGALNTLKKAGILY